MPGGGRSLLSGPANLDDLRPLCLMVPIHDFRRYGKSADHLELLKEWNQRWAGCDFPRGGTLPEKCERGEIFRNVRGTGGVYQNREKVGYAGDAPPCGRWEAS